LIQQGRDLWEETGGPSPHEDANNANGYETQLTGSAAPFSLVD
jgi:hypothetical protein